MSGKNNWLQSLNILVYRMNCYKWPCNSGTFLKQTCPVQACIVAYTIHFSQGTRTTWPCLSGQVVPEDGYGIMSPVGHEEEIS